MKLTNWFKTVLVSVALVATSFIYGTSVSAFSYLCQSSNNSYSCVSYTGYAGQQTWNYPTPDGHNCTNYAAYRLSQNGASNPGNFGNAGDWDNSAVAKGFPVNNIPITGSIAQWEAGSAATLSGHVAYVEAVTSTYIDVSEDNLGGVTNIARYYVGQADWPSHFIHIKDVSPKGASYFKSDFNNDGVSDIATYNSSGYWTVKSGASPYGYLVQGLQLGNGSETPLIGDFDNDGRADFTVYSNGQWAVKSGVSPYNYLVQGLTLGSSTCVPLVGEFGDTGRDDFAVNCGGQWAVKSGEWPYNYLVQGLSLGGSSDTSLIGDFNSDNISDFVVASGGQWAVKSGVSPNGYLAQGVNLGVAGCQPRVGDFNGDGVSDYAVDCGGQWAAKSGVGPNSMLFQGLSLGGATDTGLVGDFNGDGTTDITAYSGGQWAAKSGVNPNPMIFQGLQLGGAGHTPLAG